MGFGEEYRGMSDREILIEMATQMGNVLHGQASIALRQEKIEQRVSDIRCPSPRCQEHDRRLTTLETTEENRKDAGGNTILWIGVIIAASSALISVIALTLGG